MENRSGVSRSPAFQLLLRSGDKGTLEAQQKAAMRWAAHLKK